MHRNKKARSAMRGLFCGPAHSAAALHERMHARDESGRNKRSPAAAMSIRSEVRPAGSLTVAVLLVSPVAYARIRFLKFPQIHNMIVSGNSS
jgi:hypothetical protein